MFNSPEGSLDSLFVNDYAMIDQYAKTGSLWTWGYNTIGTLGDNTTVDQSSPVQTVAGGTNWKQVAAGLFAFHGIKTDGTLWAWGSNNYGQLGDNSTVDKSSPVQTIASGTDWKEVAGGGHYHAAAIKTDGTLWTWGLNNYGQLGDNTNTSRSSPVQTISGGTNWKQFAGGNGHSAAIKTDSTLWTWGANGYGQLGDNTSTSSRSNPVQTVAGGTNWKQVACGNTLTAAIKTDGTLWTWGDNGYGQIGDNTISPKSSPVQTIAGGITWKQVTVGIYHTAAIKTDGTLWTWGANGDGQLGTNTTTGRSSPGQTVSSGTTWKQVASLYYHIAAIKTDGRLWTWGYNYYGSLGDNTGGYATPKSSPVQTVAGGTNWKQVSANYGSTAGIYFYDANNLYPGGGGDGGP